MEQQHLVDALLVTCRKAAEAILRVYQQSDHQVQSKQDNSPSLQPIWRHTKLSAGIWRS